MLKKFLIFFSSLFVSMAFSYAYFSGDIFPWTYLTLIVILLVLYVSMKFVLFAKNVYHTGLEGELFLSTLYKSSFSVAFVYSTIYWSAQLKLASKDSVLVVGGFTETTFNEVILLVFLLLIALVSYNRCLEDLRLGRDSFVKYTVKAASWLFLTYGCLIVKPVFSFDTFETVAQIFWSPMAYFCAYPVVNIFNVEADSSYLIVVKLIFIVLSNYQLHLVLKYYKKGYVTHNFFVIILLLLWGNLFILGLDNVFCLVLTFDIIAMCTSALIVLHEKKKDDYHSKLALFYFLLSVFTSLAAYYGFYLMHTQYHISSFRAHFAYLQEIVPVHGLPNGFILFSWFLVAIKVFFFGWRVSFLQVCNRNGQ